MSRRESKELAKTNLKTWTKPCKNYSISDLRPKNTYDQHCSILLAEFNMSTLLFLLIRSLQILRSSAYSFAVLCSPLWLMFVLYEFLGHRSFIDPVYCNSCMVLSMFFRLVLANSLFSLRDINLTLGLLPPRRHVVWRHSVGVKSSGSGAKIRVLGYFSSEPQRGRNSCLWLQSRSVLSSFGVVLMSCRVNFHVAIVRSALQYSTCRI